MMSSKETRLSEVMPPGFAPVHRAIKTGTHSQFVIKGGRGGGKSSGVSEEVPLLLINNPTMHAVVIRKVANTLRTTVYAQYVWAIVTLGLFNKFKCTVSPMEITYKPTGQKIMFFGADDPGKIKSLKVAFGYVGVLHIEEVDQMNGEAEIRNIQQSVLRGEGTKFYEFWTFNPPRTAQNWANQYCLTPKPGQMIHTMTYLDMPSHWLGQRFLNDAEHLKEIDPASYEHEYLGAANGTGGQVFEKLEIREITDQEIANFDTRYCGVDWGYFPDPYAFTASHYDAARETIYLLDENVVHKQSNALTADWILKNGYQDYLATCDNAQKDINDYVDYGIRATPAIKGPGSVEYGIKWLQRRTIVIDAKRTPACAKEFTTYEYPRDRDGNFISGYVDANNHCIDSVRYAFNVLIGRRGNQA